MMHKCFVRYHAIIEGFQFHRNWGGGWWRETGQFDESQIIITQSQCSDKGQPWNVSLPIFSLWLFEPNINFLDAIFSCFTLQLFSFQFLLFARNYVKSTKRKEFKAKFNFFVPLAKKSWTKNLHTASAKIKNCPCTSTVYQFALILKHKRQQE